MTFSETQQQFMLHIRDPQKKPLPVGIEDRRMAIYRDLFFNNVEGFLSSGFPVLKSLYREDDWQTLVRSFFSEHDCHSPYFLDIAGQFIDYLSESYTPKSSDPIFMLELAHYEWVELDVSVVFEDKAERLLSTTDVTSSPLFLASTARNLSYQFAVQHISVEYQPNTPSEQPNYFVVYRDNNDDIQFLATNAMTALLLNIIQNSQGITFDVVCQQIAQQAPQFTLEQLQQGALTTLTAMAERGVIVTKNQA